MSAPFVHVQTDSTATSHRPAGAGYPADEPRLGRKALELRRETLTKHSLRRVGHFPICPSILRRTGAAWLLAADQPASLRRTSATSAARRSTSAWASIPA